MPGKGPEKPKAGHVVFVSELEEIVANYCDHLGTVAEAESAEWSMKDLTG